MQDYTGAAHCNNAMPWSYCCEDNIYGGGAADQKPARQWPCLVCKDCSSSMRVSKETYQATHHNRLNANMSEALAVEPRDKPSMCRSVSVGSPIRLVRHTAVSKQHCYKAMLRYCSGTHKLEEEGEHQTPCREQDYWSCTPLDRLLDDKLVKQQT